MNLLPFVIRDRILEYFNFSASNHGEEIIGNESTLLGFIELNFGGVHEPLIGASPKLTNPELIRYLYGYYCDDRFRKIRLVRKHITLDFRFEKSYPQSPLAVSNFVPNGTSTLHVRSESPCDSILKYDFTSLPLSVKKLRCHEIEDFENEFWKSVPPSHSNNISWIETVIICDMECLKMFHEKFQNARHITIKLKLDRISGDFAFPRCQELTIYLLKQYSDHSFISRFFPNIQNLRIAFDDLDYHELQYVPTSLIEVVRSMRLTTFQLHNARRMMSLPNLRLLLHENSAMKRFIFQHNIEENGTSWENVCIQNDCLEYLDMYSIRTPFATSMMKKLSTFEKLRHLGIHNRSRRDPPRRMNSTSKIRKRNQMIQGMTQDDPMQRMRKPVPNDHEIISLEALGVIRTEFSKSLTSLTLVIPSTNLPIHFFGSTGDVTDEDDVSQWKKLRCLMFGSLNESEIIPEICNNLPDLETLTLCCDDLVPRHIGMISNGLKTLKIFSSVNLPREYYTYLQIQSSIPILCQLDQHDHTFYRITRTDPFRIIDPLKRYRFGINLSQDEFMEPEEDSHLLELSNGGFPGPYVRGIDWKAFLKQKVTMKEEWNRMCDTWKTDEHMNLRWNMQYSVEKDVEEFLTKKGLFDELELSEMKKRHFILVTQVRMHPGGFETETCVSSQVKGLSHLMFKFSYTHCEDDVEKRNFASMKVLELERIHHNKVGPFSIYEIVKQNDEPKYTVLFEKVMDPILGVCEFTFAEEHLYRSLMNGIFGDERAKRLSLSEFFKFLYLIGPTSTKFRDGQGKSKSTMGMFKFAEKVYDLPENCEEDSNIQDDWIKKDEEKYIHGNWREQKKDKDNLELGGGGEGGCLVQ